MKLALLTVVATLVIYGKSVVGNVFFHNPRGSNNRLNGDAVTRKNANRLFDSQNNGDGGYNVGDLTASRSTSESTQFNMAYFQSGKDYKVMKGGEGRSILAIEWTNQHGCQDRDLNCNIVIQFKCQSKRQHETFKPSTMRNGYTVSTSQYYSRTFTTRSHKDYYMKNDANRASRGVHEPWEWYDKCNKRNRNGGLFTADQKLGGSTSKYTRQNANGARSGYECPEERDYYPYWHPTDWIDIAVLTDNVSSCEDYKAKSFNVQPKGECLEYYPNKAHGLKHDSKHNNKIDCDKNNGKWISFSNYLEESPQYTTKVACEAASTKSVRLIWAIPYRSEDIDNLKMSSPERCLVALDPPDCKKTIYTRSNHLGNTDKMVLGNTEKMEPYKYIWVLPYFPSREGQGCALRIRYNISTGDYDPTKTFSNQNKNTNAGVNSPVTNNPTIQVGSVQLPLRLAINTAQFGRTFQDRSHLFKIFPRPTNVHENDVIHNLNVRGKRGSAAQAFPAVEYDFVPKRLKIAAKDLMHIQWTGSNTNPNNFAGQGKAGTDRHNLVEMESPSVNYPVTSEKTYNMLTNAEIVWTNDPQTKTKQDLIVSMASSGYYSDMTICQASPKKTTLSPQLDNASPSYRGMLLRFKAGTYYYMCTRNNSFSNRSQKGRLYVKAATSPVKSKRRLANNLRSKNKAKAFHS